MKKSLLVLLFIVSCGTSPSQKPGGVGASAGQAANQEAVDGIADPAMPATQLPPAGTINIQPTISP